MLNLFKSHTINITFQFFRTTFHRIQINVSFPPDINNLKICLKLECLRGSEKKKKKHKKTEKGPNYRFLLRTFRKTNTFLLIYQLSINIIVPIRTSFERIMQFGMKHVEFL